MITPDDKDWTWVLERPCMECGFVAADGPRTELASLLRANTAAWQHLHAEGRIGPGRPDPQTWSSLEYACHVRDVHLRYDRRIELMLSEDDPLYANWDQDVTAVEDRYETQDPARVIAELAASGEVLAQRLDAVSDGQWDRPGRRSDGSSFTVESITRYCIHDLVHHIWDLSGR